MSRCDNGGIALARAAADNNRLSIGLTNLAVVELDCGEPHRAMPLLHEAVELDRKMGDLWAVAVGQANLACALILANQAAAAHALLCSIADDVIEHGNLDLMSDVLELSAAALAEMGFDERSARLAGAATTFRETANLPISAPDRALLMRSLGPARARTGVEVWEREYAAGRELTVSQATELARRPVRTPSVD